ncbi:Calcineurin-like phosphoesterase [Alteromonadaceae bacterium Bs31]|nr:Calcineurin-like phosphoesterase [Alteromonadaceae bacterium Bs31]
MNSKGYDIIGDVHGCANTLELLLQKLGYENYAAAGEWPLYRHPSRTAVFLGDVLDRGPRIRRALYIVKRMVDEGAAYCIMGNHELNALAYTTEAPPQSDKHYVREHNTRHNRQIAETLNEFAAYPEEWRMFLDWIQKRPLFLEFEAFRVVHACWDIALIKKFRSRYEGGACIDANFIRRSAIRSSFEHKFLDRLTRGTDLRLPEGRFITGRDGLDRHAFRTKFWADEPVTFRDVAFQPDPLPEDIGELHLNSEQKESLLSYHSDEKPVFVGHYWLQGEPAPIKSNLACLDYSAVKYGKLACYRFDGESTLDKEKFVSIAVTPELNAQ